MRTEDEMATGNGDKWLSQREAARMERRIKDHIDACMSAVVTQRECELQHKDDQARARAIESLETRFSAQSIRIGVIAGIAAAVPTAITLGVYLWG